MPSATLRGTSPFAPGLPLTTSEAWHLARRTAIAPSADLVAEIERVTPRAWLDAQLNPAAIADSACDALLTKHFSWTTSSTAQIAAAVGDEIWRGSAVLVASTTIRQLFSKRVLLESVVDMMSDQLYVGAHGKAEGFVLEYDRVVLRKHALGRFGDMLYAALTHPAMLAYIDNAGNTCWDVNENLGRELLELHTVGVGHYTEADVRASALLLTGHSYDWQTKAYLFRPGNHYVGPLQIMGFRHPNATASAGPAALRSYADYLAGHPATARRIATRVARRFVSDTPSPRLITHLIQVYLRTKGHLGQVVRAALVHPEFNASVGAKLRRPQEWSTAMMRAGRPSFATTATQAKNGWDILGSYHWMMGQASNLPRSWPAVNGYPDVAAAWSSTATTLARWNAAEYVADHWDKELTLVPWATVLGITPGMTAGAAALAISGKLTGFSWRAADLATLGSWLVTGGKAPVSTGTAITADQIRWHLGETVRVAFASPYFAVR